MGIPKIDQSDEESWLMTWQVNKICVWQKTQEGVELVWNDLTSKIYKLDTCGFYVYIGIFPVSML